jgi:hypothetical protein
MTRNPPAESWCRREVEIDTAGDAPAAQLDRGRAGVLDFHELMHVIRDVEDWRAVGVERRFFDGMVMDFADDDLRGERRGEADSERQDESGNKAVHGGDADVIVMAGPGEEKLATGKPRVALRFLG